MMPRCKQGECCLHTEAQREKKGRRVLRISELKLYFQEFNLPMKTKDVLHYSRANRTSEKRVYTQRHRGKKRTEILI
jgi:hypothetical protein